MANNDSMEMALVEELRDILYAEKQLVDVIPKMVKAAESEELQSAFETHLRETEGHVQRVQQALEMLGESARGKKCKGMVGITDEGADLIKHHETGPVLDAILIGAAQKVEHYEIASYGTAIAWAERLGQSNISSLLNETLDEEKATDEKLTELSRKINIEAPASA